MLACVLNCTHWTLIFFVLTGWLAPWNTVVWVHLIFIPVMILHWRTNENRCVLTELEAKFKDEPISIPAAPSDDEEGFIKSAWARTCGRAPSDRDLTIIIYSVLALVWALSFYRMLSGRFTSATRIF